jgi:hypothetical protein
MTELNKEMSFLILRFQLSHPQVLYQQQMLMLRKDIFLHYRLIIEELRLLGCYAVWLL